MIKPRDIETADTLQQLKSFMIAHEEVLEKTGAVKFLAMAKYELDKANQEEIRVIDGTKIGSVEELVHILTLAGDVRSI